jgi:hypothetical protein
VELAVGDQGGNCEFEVYQSINRCPDGARGNLVRIKHDAVGEVKTFYLHFTNVFVKTGDWVDRNTLLGTAGDSGLVYPGYVHLHFELRRGPLNLDPVPLKACHGDQLKSYPGEFGKTSWAQVAAYRYSVRSDGTACETSSNTTVADGRTTTQPASPTTTATGGTSTTQPGRPPTTIPAGASITSVAGSASGYAVPNLTIFGGVPPGVPVVPTPRVTLATDASNSPQTTSASGAAAVFGPATIFSSGAIRVSTAGSLGVDGSVSSSADIQDVNASGTEVFTADGLQSRCTASKNGVSGSTTITGGVLQISEGDPDVGGDETYAALPANPAPNTAFDGQIEVVGDTFRYIFNEQVINPDGSLTVYAAHLDLIGPTAVGDVYIGRVDCGITAAATAPTSTSSSTTSSSSTTTTTSSTTTTTTGAGLLAPACGVLRELRTLLASSPFLGFVVQLIDPVRTALGCRS